MTHPSSPGLYDPAFEHDSCGVGIIANIKNLSSHNIVDNALTMLERMEHRGAHGSEKATGDGAGIMLSIPHKLFAKDIVLPKPGTYAVAFVFLPKDIEQQNLCLDAINQAFKLFKVKLIGNRPVEVDSSILGSSARSSEPNMIQLFIVPKTSKQTFEQQLHLLYHYLNNKIVGQYSREYSEIKAKFYIASLSTTTIVYKGQLTTTQLRQYFIDLQDPDLESRYGIVHSRFSTNTFPSFKLAQPFSTIAHNGEINTLRGNINWMNSREKMLTHTNNSELEHIFPICNKNLSDSGNLDGAVRTLLNLGYNLPQAMTTLIPEAWRYNKSLSDSHKAFYHYSETLFEQWDGPAGICFSDGKVVGAKADRNGLRPLRYKITDELFIVGSEVGLVDLKEESIRENGRVAPGNILVLDLLKNQVLSHATILNKLSSNHDYESWVKKHIQHLDNKTDFKCNLNKEQIIQLQLSNGYTLEDVDTVIQEMALTAKEAVGSMGTDTPIAILSHKAQLLPSYFQQRFAQVTNPPIDSIRERDVMSLTTFIGCANYDTISKSHLSDRHILELESPVLNHNLFKSLTNRNDFKSQIIDISFSPTKNLELDLEVSLNDICRTAHHAVIGGIQLLILSDRSVNKTRVAMPSLLAVAAIHQRLVKEGIRVGIGIIVESGDVFEAHHLASLVGYGATAVYPYLALATLSTLNTNLSLDVLQTNYIEALNTGLLKIISKMGVATVWSYYGAQLFEAVGIDSHVIEKYFIGTPSKIGGLTLEGIAKEALIKHSKAFNSHVAHKILDNIGIYSWRKNQEYHAYNPSTIHMLQQATSRQNFELFKKYSGLVDSAPEQQTTIRSLLKFTNFAPIPLNEVESIENILKRFSTGAMSFGSISYEAHTTIAKAMNQIGGKSNSGEGGEDEIRYQPDENGNDLSSAIKQVASGRFGVTINYLANAREIQIKIAQGAKPGEGGQLPGAKVDEWIARVRHSTAGVGLISPPPHHDIYSIEDLAQLIFDLKNANPKAQISVKLVSQSGVGTVASGVAKAFADSILISGHDGGTGASPLSSIKHAGTPWEIGLSETHQTLLLNKLRDRVVLQADGQLKTGRDLAIATLLGAEGWGLSTAALVTTGCILTRKCHLNTCPVGIATQNKDLRALFSGRVEDIVTLFTFLAQELREIMASLGFRTINEMVGRVDKLTVNKSAFWKHNSLDLSKILYSPKVSAHIGHYKTIEQHHKIDKVLDRKLIKNITKLPYKSSTDIRICNTDRTTGAMLSNHIVTTITKHQELKPDTINYKFTGSAGQSFAAFLTTGINFTLEGEANDYVGKSLSGGNLVIYPSKLSTFEPSVSVIIGNVAFYGATSGSAYINGQAGERFCVRNSGAVVIVEGVGDHGCEYMTGGEVVILGNIGNNFASGMSGGIAYIYSSLEHLQQKCNLETVELDPLTAIDHVVLQDHLTKHLTLTNSAVAKQVLDDWDNKIKGFIKVMPKELKKVLASRGK